MADYKTKLRDDMNSLELSTAYFEELDKCTTDAERKQLWELYVLVSRMVSERAMANPNLLTAY